MIPLNKIKRRKSFTLAELMVVIVIFAILSAIVIFTLNPMRLFDNVRDNRRITDITSLHKAIGFIESWSITDLNYGNPTTVYISIPSDFPDCSDILVDLPELTPGYSYACQTKANYRKTNGDGWIPIDFQVNQGNYYLSSLPVDPENNSDYFYAYFPGGSYELMAILRRERIDITISESERKDIFLVGSPNRKNHMPIDLSGPALLLPENLASLVAHWLFDGTGTDVPDHSGNGHRATLMRSAQREQLASGKYVAYFRTASDYDRIRAYYHDGSAWRQYYNMSGWDDLTIISWVKIDDSGCSFDQPIFGELNRYGAAGFINLHRVNNSTSLRLRYTRGAASTSNTATATGFFTNFDNEWIHVSITLDFVTTEYKTYRNGVLFSEHSLTTPVRPAHTYKCIGCEHSASSVRTLKNGYMGEFQLHNGIVSEEAILNHYNETKSYYGY